jgi:hypothetical protein
MVSTLTYALWFENDSAAVPEPYPLRRLSPVVVISHLLGPPEWAHLAYTVSERTGIEVFLAIRDAEASRRTKQPVFQIQHCSEDWLSSALAASPLWIASDRPPGGLVLPRA